MKHTYICKVCSTCPCVMNTDARCDLRQFNSCPYNLKHAQWTKQLSDDERDDKNKQLASLRHDRRIALVRVDDLDEQIEALKKELGDE